MAFRRPIRPVARSRKNAPYGYERCSGQCLAKALPLGIGGRITGRQPKPGVVVACVQAGREALMAKGRDQEDGGVGKARPRRALLAAAAGGLGVIAGEAIGGAAPALADNGQAVLQGTDNGTPTARTAVLTANEIGALADPNTGGKGSLGVYGKGQNFGALGEAASGSGGTGVNGTGDGAGVGVSGTGGSGAQGAFESRGAGVFGTGGSVFGHGVLGIAGGGGASGVVGLGAPNGSSGVMGFGNGAAPG